MKHIQPSESLANGLLLAFAGGMMDAYTYLCRGQVFANAETGNLVLLGIQLAQRNWGRALYYLWPIMSFALGVLLTEWLRSHFTPLPGLPHWRQLVLVVECGGLLLVSLLPVGPLDWLANVIVSFVSAMQIESFRKFEGLLLCHPPLCVGRSFGWPVRRPVGWTLDPVGLSPPVPRLSADAPRTTVIIKRGVDIFWYPHLFFIQYP